MEVRGAVAKQCMVDIKAREAGGATNHAAYTRYNYFKSRDSYSVPLDGGRFTPYLRTSSDGNQTTVGGP
jgi:hypothetical protein